MKKPCLVALALIVAGPAICRAADSVLTYEDLTTRPYHLRRLATPPVPGERPGNSSSSDRGAGYNAQTKLYEQRHANADGGGFIRREGTGFVAAEIDGPGVIWRVWKHRAGISPPLLAGNLLR